MRTPAAPVAADAPVDLSPQALDRRLLSTEQELAKLARERAAWQQRLNESANRTNLLRDEIVPEKNLPVRPYPHCTLSAMNTEPCASHKVRMA